jgi:hypothetical protein
MSLHSSQDMEHLRPSRKFPQATFPFLFLSAWVRLSPEPFLQGITQEVLLCGWLLWYLWPSCNSWKVPCDCQAVVCCTYGIVLLCVNSPVNGVPVVSSDGLLGYLFISDFQESYVSWQALFFKNRFSNLSPISDLSFHFLVMLFDEQTF